MFIFKKSYDSVSSTVRTLIPLLHLLIQGNTNCGHVTVLYCSEQNCTVLHCSELNCTVLYCSEQNCTLLHCSELNCTVLHCTALY